MRCVLLAGSLLMAGCVAAPSVDPNESRPAALPSGTSLAAGCADGETVATWTVTEVPDIDGYVVSIAGDTEVERIAISANGEGSQALLATTVEACASGCTATLLGVQGSAEASLLTVSFAVDEDGDGFAASTCGGSDCADNASAVNPDAEEVCDGVDNDCSGIADDLADAPLADVQDGVCAGARKVCDGSGGWDEPDYSGLSGHEANEASCDGLDNDCDGIVDTDIATAPAADVQVGVCTGSEKVCDGSNGWIEPDYAAITEYEAEESTCDGLDNDCDGSADSDIASPPAADEQAGVCSGAEKVCDGSNGWIEPDYTAIADYEASEVSCDGLDNDCSGQADDLAGAPDADEQRGVCSGAKKVCNGSGGWIEPDYTQLADFETDEVTCDALDNDCDGIVDDDAPVPDADEQAGVCLGAKKVCDGANGFVEPDYTQIATYEAQESTCDGLDNDCSGSADDILDPPLSDKQAGVCTGAVQICDGTSWNEPDYTQIQGYEADEVTCDGLNNDCDDDTDTDIANPPLAQEQRGVCFEAATQVCDGANGWSEPTPTDLAAQIATFEAIEVSCDGLDNDCGGTADDIAPEDAPAADLDQGVCAGATKVCTASGWVEPDYTQITGYEARETTCGDSADNDCNGNVDYEWTLAGSSGLECWGDQELDVAQQVDPGPWRQVDLSWTDHSYNAPDYACAIDYDDQLWCWGDDEAVLSGDAVPTLLHDPTLFASGGSWLDISIENEGACGIQTDGSLWCWGFIQGTNSSDFATRDFRYPLEKMADGPFVDVELGSNHTCAIDASEGLWCWGDDTDGRLGLDTAGTRMAPEQVSFGAWERIALGTHTCGVQTDGSLWCWGNNPHGECGVDPASANPAPPTQVAHPDGGTWMEVSASTNSTCAIDDLGAVWCWGSNAWNQLGNNVPDVDQFVPQALQGSFTEGFATIEAGNATTCAGTLSGERWCWGNVDGTADAGSSLSGELAVATYIDDHGAATSLGDAQGCSIDPLDDSLWCWGGFRDDVPMAGMGTPKDLGTFAIRDIDLGGWHGCLIDDADGRIKCFGWDASGAVGNGTRPDAPLPEPVDPLEWEIDPDVTSFTHVAAGGRFGCAIDTTGRRWCWGENESYQLGRGGTGDRVRPRLGTDPGNVYTTLATGYNHGCALDDSGVLWCWGANQWTEATRLQDDTETWVEVFAGMYVTCVLDDADDLACWGNNSNGKLGDGTTTNRDAYIDRHVLPGPWRTVAMAKSRLYDSGQHVCGVKTDDSLWCWGKNDAGQLGIGSTDPSYVPVQVPGSWKTVTAGWEHTCALDLQDRLWCWGDNSEHQMQQRVDPNEPTFLEPTLVDDRPFSTLATGATRTCGVAADWEESVCP